MHAYTIIMEVHCATYRRAMLAEMTGQKWLAQLEGMSAQTSVCIPTSTVLSRSHCFKGYATSTESFFVDIH